MSASRILAATVLVVIAGCSGIANTKLPPSIAGDWTGEASGVRVEVHLIETLYDGELGPGYDISGTASLFDPATGSTTPLRPWGFNSLDGIFPEPILFNLSDTSQTQGLMYGQFTGHTAGDAALTGTIVNWFSSAVGPFGSSRIAFTFKRAPSPH